uniref:BRO1 domain-containing protein n=1 Tax=Fagus sylvatica TaxID=28930 RepID=A0A2N9IMQ2_FAGSY
MGCLVSTPKDTGGNRRRPGNIGDVSVTRIVVMAGQEAPTVTRTRRKTQHGGSTLADLLQALEDYLPVLLGLVKDGSHLQYKVQFVWVNQEDDAEETGISNAWYEVLSVLHLMAMLSLSQANLLLLPRTSADGHQPKKFQFGSFVAESRRASVDIFLKAAGYLDCAVRHVLPQLSAELRRNLPVDLAEGVLRALCLQALGQGVDIQLGMAIDSTKATLAVKRRLACEMVKYWQQLDCSRMVGNSQCSVPEKAELIWSKFCNTYNQLESQNVKEYWLAGQNGGGIGTLLFGELSLIVCCGACGGKEMLGALRDVNGTF